MKFGKEEIENRLSEIMHERNVSYQEAIDILVAERQAVVRERCDENEKNRSQVIAELNKGNDIKAIVVSVDGFTSESCAVAMAHSRIKYKKHYVLNEIEFGERHKWLVACNAEITRGQAQQILSSINSSDGNYSPEEVAAIVEECCPFDVRIKI